MIRFYFHPTPNPAKIALFLEETGLAYEALPVDTSKGEQHAPAFRAINPNGKVPAIVDTEGPGGNEVRVFDSTAILIYLAEKTGQLLGTSEDRPELLSWLLFIASGLGPFSGQAVHFQFAAPEGLDYAANRYRREAERHYQVLNDHLSGREFIVCARRSHIDEYGVWGEDCVHRNVNPQWSRRWNTPQTTQAARRWSGANTAQSSRPAWSNNAANPATPQRRWPSATASTSAWYAAGLS